MGADGGLFSEGEFEAAFGGDHDVASAPPPVAAPSAPPAATPRASPIAYAAQPEKAPTWAEFSEGWQLGLYRDPVFVGVFSGLVLGLLGVYVVLRRAVFVTAAVTQAAGLGVALAFLIGIRLELDIPPVVGALVTSLLATVVLGVRTDRLRLPRETLVGLTYLAASALAVLVGDRITQDSHDVSAILFGTAVLVRPGDLTLVATVGSLVVLLLLVMHRGFLFAGFDPENARVHRLPVSLLDLALWVLIAVQASVSTRAIGALPVFAFAVLPAMAALALAQRVRLALALAAVFGATAGGLGYLFAFFLEFPVGASQAVVATLLLLIALPVARVRGR